MACLVRVRDAVILSGLAVEGVKFRLGAIQRLICEGKGLTAEAECVIGRELDNLIGIGGLNRKVTGL